MTALSAPPLTCGVPWCGKPVADGACPAFPFRVAYLIAIRGPGGIDTVGPDGSRVLLQEPDPAWVAGQDGVYWGLTGPLLPAGTPLCTLHRFIWNQGSGQVRPARPHEAGRAV